MFAKTIIDSDAFLDMPQSSQLLYFHLSMRADDEGFINNPKSIMRNVRCTEEDILHLINKKFIIPFESGVVVIKHWKIHNYIRNDRFKPTKYQDEKLLLAFDENNAYTTSKNNVGIPSDNQMDTQVRLGKDRLGKDKESIDKPKTVRHKYGMYNNVLLSDADLEKLKTEFVDWEQRIERLSEYIASTGKSYKNHLATIRAWARKDKPQKKVGANGIAISEGKSDLEGVF
jgi:Asp-tRNA(Asn)/Glu-tRNA(Gln) amidotransferase C subunit